MFYYPKTLETIYSGVGGSYYYGDNAWKYIEAKTQVNLLGILNKIANNTTKG
jgi:hypothetical protein